MQNIHATGLVAGERGLLILGASGSGKTTLALAIIAQASSEGHFARLVADDQVLVSVVGVRLAAHAPAAIAGLAEARGLGPVPVPHEPRMIVDALVRLVPAEEAPRFHQGESEEICGIPLPRLRLPQRNVVGALPAVMAFLGLRGNGREATVTQAVSRPFAQRRDDLGLST
ncbi:HPr kinase/phosphorylase [Aquibium sp. LZ166]|uniref:HPr kinase/phosphorylase n=1 Tax=Aquibium pacificus TaxID=3153579 RepID=A0ABV3SNW4_9HYPH